jgi:steroid Delta-isomerase
MSDRVDEHFALFNAAVRSHDWTAFLATLAPGAVMRFEGVPAGPYTGRDEIARAYAEQPPSDTMTSQSVREDGDHDTIRFRWDAGGTGTLELSWRSGLITAMAIAFDS